LTAAQVTSAFGVTGFVNASADPTQVKNYFPAASKSARTGRVSVGGVNATLFGVNVQGPVQLQVVGGGSINPWFYSSTNPTNNPGSYDLWMYVSYSGKINRISNWSREPQAQ
jgi:hypothetical protein